MLNVVYAVEDGEKKGKKVEKDNIKAIFPQAQLQALFLKGLARYAENTLITSLQGKSIAFDIDILGLQYCLTDCRSHLASYFGSALAVCTPPNLPRCNE